MAATEGWQAEVCIVLDIAKVEASGGKSWCGTGAITTLENFAELDKAAPTRADVDQLANDISDHVLQKCVGPKRELHHMIACSVVTVSRQPLNVRLDHRSQR